MKREIPDDERKTPAHIVLLEHNIFIVWKPEYNLGIQIIDEQHRGIVSTINSLHFGMQNKYVDDMLTPIIDMMVDYTRIHFQIEEDFLDRIDFPHAKRHCELHQELTMRLADEARRSAINKDPYQFMDFLKQWWIHHICGEDLTFRDYLVTSKKGVL